MIHGYLAFGAALPQGGILVWHTKRVEFYLEYVDTCVYGGPPHAGFTRSQMVFMWHTAVGTVASCHGFSL